MKITFEDVGLKYRKLISQIYQQALIETENSHDNLWLTVSFVNANRIKELNRAYRQVDKETDVLSFPMLNIVYPQKLNEFTKEHEPDGSLYLGDVVICKKVAKRQAKEYGHSKKREVGFLALHGLLHLLGYDHIESEDEKIMKETSQKILDSLGIVRENSDV